MRLPKDSNSCVISTRAKSIVSYQINAEKWEYHEMTGTDHGTDMVLELIEDDSYTNKKIEIQIKGTQQIKKLKNGDITFNLEVKTINYALSSSIAFVLFLVDVEEKVVYYLPLQDYFIANPDKFASAQGNQKTMAVHIASDSILDEDAHDLCEIAKSIYVDGPGKSLRKIR